MKRRKISSFEIINITILIAFCLLVLLPFLHVVSLSFSAPESSFVEIRFWPEVFTLKNYRQVLRNRDIYTGFMNSIFRTVVGTALSVLATVCAAYPLSKRNMPHKNFWTIMVVFTMFFNAGLIPTYLWNKQLGLMDNKLVLILPGLISAYNVVIARNFFMGIPDSLEESAKIDGANDIVIFFRIVAPMSKAIIATLALWIAVGHWNAWFDSMLYIRDASNQVLQVVMRRIVLEGQIASLEIDDPLLASTANPETIKAATIMVTTIPILCVYPFVQKYFVKGVIVGSVKG